MLFNWYYSLGPLAEAVVSQDYSFDRKGSRRNFCPLPFTVLTPSLLQAPFLNKTGTTIHRTSFFFFFVNLLLKALISSVWCFTTVLHLGLKRMLKKEDVQIGGQGQDVFEQLLLLLWSVFWPCRQRQRSCPPGDCAPVQWDIHPCLLQVGQLISMKLSVGFSVLTPNLNKQKSWRWEEMA